MCKWRKADFMKDWKSGWNHVGIKQFWCLGPRAGTVASCQFLKVNPKLIYQNKFDLVFNIGIFNIGIEPAVPLWSSRWCCRLSG